MYSSQENATIVQKHSCFHSALSSGVLKRKTPLLRFQPGLQKSFDCVGIPLVDAKGLLDDAVFVHQVDDGVSPPRILDVETGKLLGHVALGKRLDLGIP